MAKEQKTRILCKKTGVYHTVTFHADGTASSPCGDDLMLQAQRVSGLLSLGKPVMENSCVGLVALVLYGIPMVFQQPPPSRGYIEWGAWDRLYTRFESVKVVAAAVRREQRAYRKRLSAAARAA